MENKKNDSQTNIEVDELQETIEQLREQIEEMQLLLNKAAEQLQKSYIPVVRSSKLKVGDKLICTDGYCSGEIFTVIEEQMEGQGKCLEDPYGGFCSLKDIDLSDFQYFIAP
jgi:SOS response regulatory protein OraA/RecX